MGELGDLPARRQTFTGVERCAVRQSPGPLDECLDGAGEAGGEPVRCGEREPAREEHQDEGEGGEECESPVGEEGVEP